MNFDEIENFVKFANECADIAIIPDCDMDRVIREVFRLREEVPEKPILLAKHTSEDVLKYAKELSKYEKGLMNCNKRNRKIDCLRNEVTDLWKTHLRKQYCTVDDKYFELIFAKAWVEGYYSGYSEVRAKFIDIDEFAYKLLGVE